MPASCFELWQGSENLPRVERIRRLVKPPQLLRSIQRAARRTKGCAIKYNYSLLRHEVLLCGCHRKAL